MWSIYRLPKLDRNMLVLLAHINQRLNLYNSMGIKITEKKLGRHILQSLKAEGLDLQDKDSNIEYFNLDNALNYVVNLVENKVPLTKKVMLDIHRILSNSLLSDNYSGNVRDCPNFIGNGNYRTAQVNQINKLLDGLFDTIDKIENPIVKAAYFSYNLVSIHPFVDFNGRLSRLCESYILMYYGYPIISLDDNDIDKYMKLIRVGQENEDSIHMKYIEFVANKVLEGLNELIEAE